MGRLIDADDAINIFTNRLFETLKTNLPCVTAEENQICLDTCYKVAKYEIDDIPTAYDVDKVVAELEKQLLVVEIEDEHIVPESDVDEYFELDVVPMVYAREIVRKGGVNE